MRTLPDTFFSTGNNKIRLYAKKKEQKDKREEKK
jgi:hypothetical protein